MRSPIGRAMKPGRTCGKTCCRIIRCTIAAIVRSVARRAPEPRSKAKTNAPDAGLVRRKWNAESTPAAAASNCRRRQRGHTFFRSMDHLSKLEHQSVYLFREAFHSFKHLCMPWSMGKDSNVLIWLAKKAFFGKIPFPLLHVDTTYEFPEMYEFRDWATEHHKIDLKIWINEDARKRGIGYETHDPVTVTHELKTMALQQAMAHYKWDALITGIRRDEDATRAKERYFSPRNAEFEWDYKDQPPEFWNQFASDPGE